MRLAFVSYEFPPDTGIGGIGTYTYHIARLFSQQGVEVEVICGSGYRNSTEELGNLTIVRLQCSNADAFYRTAPQVVSSRHLHKPFSLVEVPEHGGGAVHLKNFLKVPLVVKLHTPSFLVKEINDTYYNRTPMRKAINAFKKKYHKENDKEYHGIMQADFVLSPSCSLKQVLEHRWKPICKIIHAPNPFDADHTLLNIPVHTNSCNVLYTGRLETRKGVWNLAKAIPHVLQQVPQATFTFVGSDSKGPHREASMKSVLLREIRLGAPQVTFVDRLPLEQLPQYLEGAAVCVYPSLWENFPNVCLEAMAAGRPVVGSRAGGMAEMLDGVPGAALVDPHDVKGLAKTIVHLLQHSAERFETAQHAREKIMTYYQTKLVGELLALYRSFVT